MKKLIRIFSLFLFLSLGFKASAQNNEYRISWSNPISYGLEGEFSEKALFFEEAKYNFEKSNIPFYQIELSNLKSNRISSIDLEIIESRDLSESEKSLLNIDSLPLSPEIDIANSTIRKKNVTYVSIFPVYKTSLNEVKALVRFKLKYKYQNANVYRSKSMTFASSSAMETGEWYKIAVLKEGVYKLNYNFLLNLGVDVENIDPRNLKVFGYGGGALPEDNSLDRPDDMQENPIFAIGEQDGSFDPGDGFLFFGDDQVTWRRDEPNSRLRHRVNPYSDTTFYFIAITDGKGKRIQTRTPSASTVNNTSNSYDYLIYHEQDLANLISSGREWVGEIFDTKTTYNFSWDVPNLILTEPGTIEFYGVARAGVTSTFNLQAESTTFNSSAGGTVLNRYEVGFGKVSRRVNQFSVVNNPIDLSITYVKPQSVAKAWLNFVNLNLRRNLVMLGDFMSFRDLKSIGQGNVTQFTLNSNSKPQIWDVTDLSQIESMSLNQNGASYSFKDETDELKEYVAFLNADSSNLISLGPVQNQNLHALPQTDMVIVSNPKFLQQAEELALFHRGEGLSVHVVTTNQVFNEFSSGAQDVVAIRSLMKMFYDRSVNSEDMPRYLLLYGDASYDLKNRVNGNTNYIVGYQSSNFLQPVFSYISDDFLGLLDNEEGTWPTNTTQPERLDIAVGRLPVKTKQEAEAVLQKIKSYNTSNTLADWRNKVVFVGDDEDGVTHMSQSNQLANVVSLSHADMQVEKIFLDAFKQESTSAGSRYPEVNKAITRAVQDGSLIINYTGHGGETGWAGERILSIRDISSWDQMSNMPVFLTATCEFSRFDDPFRTSAGELVLLNEKGGGAALMTTTRLVYSSPNFTLNRSFYNFVFRRNTDGNFDRVGDIFMATKNANAGSSNARNFSLLGDPALKIAIPKHQVITTTINGQPLAQGDTLKALSKVTIAGYVSDYQGNKLSGYNGTIYPTVFDKERRVKSLNNDGAGVFEFDVRDSRIFKGKASVVNGDFSFSFIVPKDISYSFGNGKVIYYTEDGTEDGNGYTQQIVVGGSNNSALADQTGPEVDLYMNNENFVYGGITSANPTLLVKLFDEQGVNTVGSGIGHDLVATLDGNSEQSFVLNEFYEAEKDDYQRGSVRFPLQDLSEGKHSITFKAWDVANNSSEKTIEFVVQEEREIEIDNLLNYPNPFTTNTEFIFQHNQAGTPLDVKLEIFTVSGKLVKSFNEVILNDGYVSRDIRWDGRDDYGDRIGKGVYIYKMKVRSRNGSSTEKFEKLVIL